MYRGMHFHNLSSITVEFTWNQKSLIPVTPLTDSQVTQTFRDMEDVIRYRLRMSEVVPVEMSQYRIGYLLSYILSLED